MALVRWEVEPREANYIKLRVWPKIHISVHLWQSKAIMKPKSLHWYIPASCPTQTNQLIESVHCVAGMYRGTTIGLESLNQSSYKTEKLFEQYPWGCYGLSPIAHFFYYIPPLGGVWGILKPGRWSHHRVDWWWWCMRDITFSSKTPAPLSYFSEAEAEIHYARHQKCVHIYIYIYIYHSYIYIYMPIILEL